MEKQQERSKFRPNLIIMIIAVAAITIVGMVALGTATALPLATAAIGGLAGLGLALVKPEDEPLVEKHDPDVVMPLSGFKAVGTAPTEAYERGFHAGVAAGRKIAKE